MSKHVMLFCFLPRLLSVGPFRESFSVLIVSVMGTRGSGRVHCTVSASPVAVGQFVSITCHFSPDLR